MKNSQLDSLLALKIVAEERSFSAAADEMGVSPSAVSQTIKNLENHLGIALLTRTTRSTSLTEAGERFLQQAGPAIDLILSALEDVGAYAQRPSGLLRLNMPRLVYPSYLAPIIAGFAKKHPEVTVECFFEDEVSDVVKHGFDAGIRLSDILAKDMVALKLYGPIRFVTAASPKYLQAMGRPKHPKDLLGHNCIRIRLGQAGIYDRWDFEHKGSEFQVQVKGSFIFNDPLLTIAAGVEGGGVIYINEEAISDQVKNGELEIILDQFVSTSTGFYLYYPKRSQVQPKLRAFLDYIKDAKAL